MPIYGTRPEAIKFAPVVRMLLDDDRFQTTITVTGQHREMLDQVNELFGLVPDHDLDIIRPRQTLVSIAAATMTGLDRLLNEEKPDCILVQGDTSTAFVAALTAFYHQIPVVHLEAGLRSHDLSLPFPEEGNRKLLSQIAALHLAPTPKSKQNLLADGVAEQNIVITGNSVIDALLFARNRPSDGAFEDPVLDGAIRRGGPILLVTSHRRENLNGGMERIGGALAEIAQRYPDLTIILPVHKNPAVREALLPPLVSHSNIVVTEPVQYMDFVRLLDASDIVLTDSGGIQEEAPALGKPVLVMRESTERPEAVDYGVVELVGTSQAAIVAGVTRLIDSPEDYERMSRSVNPYGDGRAAERTIAALAHMFHLGERMPDFLPGEPSQE